MAFPLTKITLSTHDLSTSRHIPALYELINVAFDHGHYHGYKSVVLREQRLQDHSQIMEEIGPEGFCILAFATEQPDKLIATASAKPYALPGEETGEGVLSKVNKLFKRTKETVQPVPPDPASIEDEEKLPAWEILLMAVDPELQGRGIATRLLDDTIQEIRSHFKANQGEGDGEVQVPVKILLSTLKELNEGYYQRKGWRTTLERRFEAGVGGSEEGFGIVDMVKVVR